MPDSDLPTPDGKIFPRNLTARADQLVRGNPAGTRPESGVDNCFPGLEFDQRNLDKAFLPGLTVDFHRPAGSQVIAVTGGPAAEQGLTDADLPLHLWAVCGRTTVDQTEERAPIFTCTDLDGLEVWRRVHDLLPGRIAVLIGPVPGRFSPGADALGGDGDPDLNDVRLSGQSFVQRGEDGAVQGAVLVTDRARYLDENGVIDPDVYRPGDLTRSLCAPWQYDFRDCGCFYWAASKPDITTSSDGRFFPLNFQRSDRTTVPPRLDGPRLAGRRGQELDYPDLIGNWNVLPVVLNGREDDGVVLPAAPDVELLTRDQVITELEYLATVEHALCVEYLYAHYSLQAPMKLPDGADRPTRQIFAAADEVFNVAVDEMRHFRWVNEALGTLGRPPATGRATTIHRQLDRPFELKPLTPEQLDWFIDVERPSQDLSADPATIDGMYVQLHQSVVEQPELFPEATRLAHLIKLIIDEGADHFRRFTAVKQHLAALTPGQYLRPLGQSTGDPLVGQMLVLADQYYTLLLAALQATFALGDRAGGLLIEQARRTMFNLHEVNHALAARGVAPRFTLPVTPPPTPPVTPPAPQAAAAEHAEQPVVRREAATARIGSPAVQGDGQAVRAAAEAAARARETISSLGGGPERAMMLRQQDDVEGLLAALGYDGGRPGAPAAAPAPPTAPPEDRHP